MHLIVSVRTPDDLYYADELTDRADATVLYTRATPPDVAATRPDGSAPTTSSRTCTTIRSIYVCGSAPFTDAVGDLLVDLGVAPERVRFERFGPSA